MRAAVAVLLSCVPFALPAPPAAPPAVARPAGAGPVGAQPGASVEVVVRGLLADTYAIFEPFAGVPKGSQARLSFRLDPADFVDDPAAGRRGYPIDPSSFALSVGDATGELLGPPLVTSPVYFVIDDDATGSDRFSLSLDLERITGAPLDMPAGYFVQKCRFELSLDAAVVSSPVLLDAPGSIDESASTGVLWVVDDWGFHPLSMRFQGLTIRPE